MLRISEFMGFLFFNPRPQAKNGNAILIVLILGAFITWAVTSLVDWAIRRSVIEAYAWRLSVSEEVAEGGMSVLEAALERRLWEFPPDAECMKSLTTSANGTVKVGPFNAHYDVTATLE